MSTIIERTADKNIYLQENRYDTPKEIFRLLGALSSQTGLLGQSHATVVDFGCAAGEFLYYLAKSFPGSKYVGYDVLPELIDKARVTVRDVEFKVGSVLDSELVADRSVDLSFLQGVHSIFDDFESCFSNLIRWTKPGGKIFIFGLFNPYPLDVWVQYRHSNAPNRVSRESGWNIFSKISVSTFIDKTIGKNFHTYTQFEMPYDLEKRPEDFTRTWTYKDIQGKRYFTNGLSLICNLEILEISV